LADDLLISIEEDFFLTEEEKNKIRNIKGNVSKLKRCAVQEIDNIFDKISAQKDTQSLKMKFELYKITSILYQSEGNPL
jgi:tellurite resistance protein